MLLFVFQHVVLLYLKNFEFVLLFLYLYSFLTNRISYDKFLLILLMIKALFLPSVDRLLEIQFHLNRAFCLIRYLSNIFLFAVLRLVLTLRLLYLLFV